MKDPGKRDEVKVGFLMQNPAMWGNICPVYERMRKREGICVYGFVLPGYEGDGYGKYHDYDRENEYFHQRYGAEVRDILDEKGHVIDLEPYKLDYFFYQRPYEDHRPAELSTAVMSRKLKTCYIPYGYNGLERFERYAIAQRDFFSYLYFLFADSARVGELFRQAYREGYHWGEKRFTFLGFPPLERALLAPKKERTGKKKLLWMPRWTVEDGHFLEYREKFLELGEEYPELELSIRPHPLLFDNLRRRGLFTPEEREEFEREMAVRHVGMDQNMLVEDTFAETDILLTDFSSAVILFFMTGNPVIYCASAEEMNENYRRMAEGMYMAGNWEEIRSAVAMLAEGRDPLEAIRGEIISTFREENMGAADRIVDAILYDSGKTK